MQITPILDRRHCSEATVANVKYKSDTHWVIGHLLYNNNGLNGIHFTSMASSCENRLTAYHYASWWGLCLALHLCAILNIWGVCCTEETVVSGVTFFGWKPPLTNSQHFTDQRSTFDATQSSITLWSLNCPAVLPLHGTDVGGSENRTPVPRVAALTHCHYATQPDFNRVEKLGKYWNVGNCLRICYPRLTATIVKILGNRTAYLPGPGATNAILG